MLRVCKDMNGVILDAIHPPMISSVLFPCNEDLIARSCRDLPKDSTTELDHTLLAVPTWQKTMDIHDRPSPLGSKVPT